MGAFLASLVQVYVVLIILRIVLSWFPPGGSTMRTLHDWLMRLTEPVLGPVRRRLPPLGGLDLSPIVVLLFLQIVVQQILLGN